MNRNGGDGLLQIPAAILDSIESLHLPPIPQILLRFLHLTEDDRATLSDLAALAPLPGISVVEADRLA